MNCGGLLTIGLIIES